jgi:DNA-binding NarL/FixJ family response regulator
MMTRTARAPSLPLPGEGVTDTAELARIVELLRASEQVKRDIVIGEFSVGGARVPVHHIPALQTLTRNEAAVLRFLGWGRANADIGTLLNMTENTVRTHMNNAIRKLELDGVRELNSLAGLLFLPLD